MRQTLLVGVMSLPDPVTVMTVRRHSAHAATMGIRTARATTCWTVLELK
jgi:hypothetical protein